MHRSLAALALGLCLGCATTPKARPPIVAGEVLIRTEDPAGLTTEALRAALGRDDFEVKATDCLPSSACRVVLARAGGPADEGWTWELIDALSRNQQQLRGVRSVEANAIAQPR